MVCFFVSLGFSNVEWYKYRNISMNNEKPIFYFLSASYCAYCKDNLRIINSELDEYVNKHFLPVYEVQDKEVIPRHLNISLVPAYYILDKSGNILLGPLKGSRTKSELLHFLNKGLYKNKTREMR